MYDWGLICHLKWIERERDLWQISICFYSMMMILGLGFINPSLHFEDHIGFRVYESIIALG